MKKSRKSAKILSAITAFVVSLCVLTINYGDFTKISAAPETKYEFEDGTTDGHPETYTDGNPSGSAIIIKDNNQSATVTVNVPEAGMYEIIMSVLGVGASKEFNVNINGKGAATASTGSEDSFHEITAALVKLNKGDNTITAAANWTWFAVDYVRVVPAQLAELKATGVPSDPNATKEAKSLMAYLQSVYGKNIISGQQEDYGSNAQNEAEFKYIEQQTGKLPAIRGFEMATHDNPLFGWNDGTEGRIVDWDKKNGIATACWHIAVPKNFAAYKLGDTMNYSETSFYVYEDGNTNNAKAIDIDVSKMIVKGTKEYDYYQLCLKSVAETFGSLQKQNIPVIWRPLHEAEGSGGANGSGAWFWWGMAGAEVYKELWKITYETLVDDYGLHNLIWEYNSYNYASSAQWYPGDEYVDIIGYDKYNASQNQPNESAIASTFYGILEKTGGGKMIAMSENDTIPALNNLIDEKAYWLYFCPWYQNYITSTGYNAVATLKEIYQSDYCITLDELPDWKNFDTSGVNPGTPTTTTKTTTTSTTKTTTASTTTKTSTTNTSTTSKTASSSSTTISTTAPIPSDTFYGDVDLNGIVNISDIVILAKNIAGKQTLTSKQLANANVNGDSSVNSKDLLLIIKFVFGEIESF